MAIALLVSAALLGCGPANAQDFPQSIPKPSITAVAFSPDGKYVMGGDNEGVLTLWTVDGGKFVTQFKAPSPYPVRVLVFAPDSKRIIGSTVGAPFVPELGGQLGEICIWAIPSGKLLKALDTTVGAFDISMSKDGTSILTIGEDKLRSWNLSDFSLIRDFGDLGKNSRRIAVLPSGTQALVDHEDGLAIVDLSNGKIVSRFKQVEGFVRDFTPDGSKALMGYKKNLVLVDLKTQKRLRNLSLGPDDGNDELGFQAMTVTAISSDAKYLLRTSWVGPDHPGQVGIVLWSTHGGDQPREFYAGGSTFGITALCFSSNGRLVASGECDNSVKIWDTFSGRHRFTLVPPEPKKQPKISDKSE